MSSTDHQQPQFVDHPEWDGWLKHHLGANPDLAKLQGFRYLAALQASPRPAHDPMDFLAGATVMAAVCGLLALALPAAHAAGAALLALVLLALFCRRERDRTRALRANQGEQGR